MATAALLNLPPSHRSFPSSTAAAFWWTNTLIMHVTRPKSAKGRTRPRLSCSQSVEACPYRVPPPPPPAAPHELANRRRESSTKRGFPASHVFPEEIPGLLQQVPLRSCSSLNKYRVLPSIGCRGAGSGAVEAVAEQIDQLKVSSGHGDAPTIKTLSGEQESAGVMSEIDGPDEEGSHVQRPLANPGRKMRQVNPSMSALSLEEPPKKESCLLLAIRSPSGQRFEHHFKPTDSLQTVLAVAEQKTAAKYKRCSVETMEVPRRSFSDLTRSLHDCGILHKSVLCIQQKEQHDTDL
ncbi:UBX domain protein 10 [Columba livia]|uniref:UBX domain protein 10 n=1 Tax=Columba livia TaxID=8932 RepID=A0A2I0M2T1_COLLI|nr:UBX domain-containing protein 10 [Columba livia]XP_021150894.1 UBX domain-containing protein 10 [Columba livia]XP_021150895.1 UBX domain-containing protein 10 [Columba livia]XP_021150896.1 UBX domain-containing protein 10 [Columba livia]XP_021150897.1 UBX domain-containing protein 10 [Columba livia]XP_021150898.1 UBX domain-containing protein 10 [Columba livia]PKK23983.1 UBX domain protein 10 [Columba livia]